LGIEVTCGHEICMKCILKAMPQESSEIGCKKCNTPQRIKNSLDIKSIEKARQQVNIPKLKCKAHQLDSI